MTAAPTDSRVLNFGPGPSALPLPVLERIQEELLDFRGTGMSILESSHRGPAYDRVHRETVEKVMALTGAESHAVLFMTGGAKSQFSLVPMNLRTGAGSAAYLDTGRWSQGAVAAAKAAMPSGEVATLWSGESSGYDRVPEAGDYAVAGQPDYLHYTSNNTIYGTQYHASPDANSAPLVADMSSDILSRPLDAASHGVIYAGAQKNLGVAGVTLVLVRRDLLERSADDLPPTMSYARMAAKNSLLNTPPVFAIYAMGLVLGWIEELGGVSAMAERNRGKADALYGAIDRSGGYFRGHAQAASRSQMNVTFRLPDEAAEGRFLDQAANEGLVGLKGHRSVGGIRASLYNAVEPTAVDALVAFMDDFVRRNG